MRKKNVKHANGDIVVIGFLFTVLIGLGCDYFIKRMNRVV